jgi:hypothetical protein
MYPPRQEPSLKERQESARRGLDIFQAIAWPVFGAYTMRYGNDPGYATFLMSIGIPPAADIALRKCGVNKERRQLVGKVESVVMLIAIVSYVVYHHAGK